MNGCLVIGIEDNDDGKLEESGVDRSNSALFSPKQISNPVVYKLVRVEGDGRLVPATDDEVMEVEDFLEYENSDMRVVADTGQSLECISIERSSSGKLRLECSEGVSQLGTSEADLGKLNAKFQILQKVKQEEKLRLSSRSPVHSHVQIDSQCSADNPVIIEKVQSKTPYQEAPSIASSLNYSHSNQSGSIDQCSRPSEGVIESGSSASAVNSALTHDFSMTDGEICLDKLSVKELHELFKVTFGRETTVKDKQWLRRRIAMSLTNSCDVSATTFTVKDKKITRKCEAESSGNVSAAPVISVENMAGEGDVKYKDSCVVEDCRVDDNQVASETRLETLNTEHELGDEDQQSEERAAKRMRKPTKRYIEELSENESREYNPRSSSSNKNTGHIHVSPTSNKNTGHRHVSPTSQVRPAANALPEARTFVTRLDSLGGSAVQIPRVSRVRRSRPRKTITSLMKFHPTGMVEAAKLGNKVVRDHGSEADSVIQDKISKPSSMPVKIHQPVRPTESASDRMSKSTSESGKEKQCPVTVTTEPRQESKPKKTDTSSCTEERNIVTVPTAKGGMRRKHHRAWTLVEVMKLIEGVSRCGPGRWSEIKRLSFSSYSHRTSVDLKDKWRNLLKASFAPTPADEGMNSRKHGTAPIPEPILVRVRELAEINSQVPPNFSSSKLTTTGGTVSGDRLGYL
ncbi:MYB family transcription factor [Trifolium pratense]|uniref:MYB family transcription factor n=1 Tax=Trifolium pratense TaxID=57577 RepID=A0A2K3PBP9_TRIPR|nr:MYB family transcription factor [Trifolium pratense]